MANEDKRCVIIHQPRNFSRKQLSLTKLALFFGNFTHC